jgi:hypothetical protein
MKTIRKLSLLALFAFACQAIQCTPTKTEAEIKDLELQVKALELKEKYDYLKAKQDLQECLLNHKGATVPSRHTWSHPPSCDEFVRTFAILAGSQQAYIFIGGYYTYHND